MKKTTKLIEVQTPKGEPLFQLKIVEGVLSEGEVPANPQPSASTVPSKPPVSPGGNGLKPQNGNGNQNTEDMMTEPQKKYLFRIMAERGKTGDEAHDHLKGLFKVKTLKEVTKLEASQMIETLLSFSPAQGNGGGDGRSF